MAFSSLLLSGIGAANLAARHYIQILPHPQPPPPQPVIGKAPIGKYPIGKSPAPVVTKG
jgi:hypothetical protein